jgi:hypothetical protein
MKHGSQQLVRAVFTLSLLSGFAPHAAFGESIDWPCWRGSDGNGLSRETNWDPHANATPRIAGGVPRLFWTPPVPCNARIYCRNFTAELACIDVRK